MDASDRKQCPQCCELIQAGAKKCPHCLSPQGGWAGLKNPALAGLIPMLIVLPFLWFSFRSINKPINLFETYRDKVQVVISEMYLSTEDGKNMVSAIGEIQNNSAVTWKQVKIEADLYDSAGNLIDTSCDSDSQLTLSLHARSMFRVRFVGDKPRSKYASQKVSVRDASDAHRWL